MPFSKTVLYFTILKQTTKLERLKFSVINFMHE